MDSEAAAHDKQATLDSLCVAALNHTYHGRFDESDSVLNGIMTEFNLSRKSKAVLYGLMGQNAWLSGNYPMCYHFLSKSLSRKELKKQELQRTLSQLPQETLDRPEDEVLIKYTVDSLFYQGEFKGCEMRLPVMIGGMEEMMILDNGCAFFSLASETFANEHGIRPIGINGNAIGTVDKVSMWIGIADSLSIASLSFKNILFTVIQDEYLQNPVSKIDAALGANIFRLVGEMDFDNVNGEVAFPFKQNVRESNIMIEGNGCHYVDAVVGRDTLKLQLDLGSSSTQLNSNYFTRFKDRVLEECSADTAMYGGVGGTDSEPVYRFDLLDINACGGSYSVQNAKISTTKKSNEGDEFGVLGMDFLLSFNHASLNLRTMNLKLE